MILKRYSNFLFIMLCIFYATQFSFAQITPFTEFGTTIHGGKHIPLWQVSNQHGLSSLDNSAYLRGGFFYTPALNNKKWHLDVCADLVVAAGMKPIFRAQQIYVDARYRSFGIWGGVREINSNLLNQDLSSGGLVWSGNASPIPQFSLGLLDYLKLSPGVRVKAQISYGWFAERDYQQTHSIYNYVTKIKYHHKSFYFRFGRPERHWMFDIGMRMETQYGGYLHDHNGNMIDDLGNGVKGWWQALIPLNGGEGKWFNGNFLGSETFRLTYHRPEYALSVYLENYYDDFSGMGKQNGMDGLWGIEYKSSKYTGIQNIVLEYYQTTHQSGPLHGVDFSEASKTGGADNYYNHYAYLGWHFFGKFMGNPFIVSPEYNEKGDLSLKHTRVKAVHLGWSGKITTDFNYKAKISFNKSWGTVFFPTPDILENFSAWLEVGYLPHQLKGWQFKLSGAFDTGNIYGDNFGFQFKVRKTFDIK